MFYLIDGYNLLHQTPLLTRDRNDGWLQRARERLVGFIRTKLASDDSSKATIVFDTQRSAPSLGDSIDYGNVQVLFARSHDEADDLLEELIEQCRTPSSLCVVSSDRRVQAAGKRFHAKEIIDSRTWFEWLDSLPDSNDNAIGLDLPKVEQGGSEISLASTGAADVDYWLREFGLIFEAPTPLGRSKSPAQSIDTINLNQMPDIDVERIKEPRKAKKALVKKKGPARKTEVPKDVRDRSSQTSPDELRQRANRELPDVENPFGDDLGND